MSRNPTCLFLSFVLAACPVVLLLTVQSSPAQDSADGSFAIVCKGKVVDTAGNPVEGAEVIAYHYERSIGRYSSFVVRGTATTSADGVFRIDATADRVVAGYAAAWKKGHAHGWRVWNVTYDEDLTITLRKPMDLSGVVVDEAGVPLAGVEVRAFVAVKESSNGRSSRPVVRQESLGQFSARIPEWLITTTDSQGRFRFTDLPEGGSAFLFLSARGRAKLETRRRDTERGLYPHAVGDSDIRITLPAEAVIRGKVIERDSGKPISGIHLMAWDVGREGVSAADGTFEVGALQAGTYRICLSPWDKPADWTAEAVSVTLGPGETKTDVLVKLSGGGVVEVLVKDADTGEPIEGVGISGDEDRRPEYLALRTGGDGVARMRLLPGLHVISSMSSEGYHQVRTSRTFEVFEGQTTRLEYTLVPRARRYSGVVLDSAGEPVANAVLTWWPIRNKPQDTCRTDSQGRFEADISLDYAADHPEEHSFVCAVQAERNLAVLTQVPPDRTQFEITVAPAFSLKGRFIDPKGAGVPAPEAHLLLEIPHGDGHSVRSTPFEVDNGPDGAFQIPTVAVPRLGNYCLRLTAPGFAIKDREIFLPLEPRGTIDLGNIILKPANLSVSGIVVDSSGNPVAGVEVVAAHSGRPLDDEPDTLEWQREDARAVTAADGTFRISNVAEGRLSLFVSEANGHAQARSMAGDSNVKLILMTDDERKAAEEKRRQEGLQE